MTSEPNLGDLKRPYLLKHSTILSIVAFLETPTCIPNLVAAAAVCSPIQTALILV